MKRTVLLTAGGLLLAANGTVLAQTTPPSFRSAVQAADQIAAEQIIGRRIVNARDQKIGDVNSVALGADGRVDAVIVGVGGLFGLGERDVALRWNDLIMGLGGRSMRCVADKGFRRRNTRARA